MASAAVTGGHGNGGKFYMREMWKDGARFATWRDGHFTSLIVDRGEDGSTGEWEHVDQKTDWRSALRVALPSAECLGDPDALITYLEHEQSQLVAELNSQRRGFSVVAGRRGIQTLNSNDVVVGNKRWDHQRLVDEIRDAPQARRPIRELAISVFINSELGLSRLTPETILEDPEWLAEKVDVPISVIQDAHLQEGATSVGVLVIKKSLGQLTGRQRHHNAVFVTDGAGNPIASYPVKDLPLPGNSPIISFIQAELELHFPRVDALIENDRERLVTSPTTQAILEWVAERVWERARAVEEAQRSQQNKAELQIAAILNDALNRHARRFLEELQTEILVDWIEDPEGGGPAKVGRGVGPRGASETKGGDRSNGTGGDHGQGGTIAAPGTQERIRRPKFPQVLLSGIDADPAKADGSSKDLTPYHPPLDQDDMDKRYNVWWINTTHPFAKEALKRGGAKGHAFRSHQLSMFRDVVQREALRLLQRRELELALDIVENELSEISNRFLADLPHDLVEELLG
jgi:hypothetical protein